MRSITHKTETLRKAVAVSQLKASPESLRRLELNDLPKKDVFAVARVAAIMAAKKTHELIPYCHPLLIDFADIEFEVRHDLVMITASVIATAKTGVEMEALTASSVAALTVYDMLKPVDSDIEILSTKLVSKKGGKGDFKEWTPPGFSAAVIVTSDSTSAGKRQDKSGKIIRERLEQAKIPTGFHILPDDEEQIVKKLKELCDQGIKLILTTGGTGLGPRDVTVEATRKVIERQIPGIMEAGRGYGQRRTPYAMLSRGVAGQRGQTLIINLPGSSRGTEETLNAIFPAVLHAYGMMQGDGH